PAGPAQHRDGLLPQGPGGQGHHRARRVLRREPGQPPRRPPLPLPLLRPLLLRPPRSRRPPRPQAPRRLGLTGLGPTAAPPLGPPPPSPLPARAVCLFPHPREGPRRRRNASRCWRFLRSGGRSWRRLRPRRPTPATATASRMATATPPAWAP